MSSLEGSPNIVNGNFNCSWCDSLNSLEGSPNTVNGNFICKGCGVKFTEEEVRKHCNVEGDIYV